MKRMLTLLIVLQFGLISPLSAEDLTDDLSFQIALPQAAVPIERAEEIIFGNGIRQWRVQCSNADAAAVALFHKQLWANFKNDPVRNTANLNGAFNRTRTDVLYCSPVDTSASRYAAWEQPWWAWCELTYVFYLKQQNAFGIELDGGVAEEIQGVKTSVVRRMVDAFIDWDAEFQVLSVTVSDFDNPYDTGTQIETAPYYVTGKSVTSAVSLSSSVSTNFTVDVPKPNPNDGDGSPKQKTTQTLSIGASTYKDVSKKRVRVRVEGAEYWAEFGRFTATEYRFSDGSQILEFGFAANWITNVSVEYNEVASVTNLDCTSNKGFKVGVSFSDFITGASFKDEREVVCVASSSQLPMYVSWSASPTLNLNTGEYEGLNSRIRWIARVNPDGSGSSWYQPRFSSEMNWRFFAYPTEGTGGVIDVINSGTTPIETKRFYVRTVE